MKRIKRLEKPLLIIGGMLAVMVLMAQVGTYKIFRLSGDTGNLVAVNSSGALSVSGATSFGDANLTNIGDIALDSLSSDAGTTITVALGTDAGDDLLVGNNNALVVEGDNDQVGIKTAAPASALDVEGVITASGASGQMNLEPQDGSGTTANIDNPTGDNITTVFGTGSLVMNASALNFTTTGDSNMSFATNNGGGEMIMSWANNGDDNNSFRMGRFSTGEIRLEAEVDSPFIAADAQLQFEPATPRVRVSAGYFEVSSGGIVPDFITADPCAGGNYPEGAIFYNDTSDYMCFCNGAGADVQVHSPATACF